MGKVEIIPAGLAQTKRELKAQFDKICRLNKKLHTDFADGAFVENRSVGLQFLLDLPQFYPRNEFELHLMAWDSLSAGRLAVGAGYKTVIFHSETLKPADLPALSKLKKSAEIFLAVLDETGTERAKPFLDYANGVTVMTVKAGGQGREFEPKNLAKIKTLRSYGFLGAVEVDGGINLATIEQAAKAGASRLVVGSALTKAEDPKKVYNELLERVNE